MKEEDGRSRHSVRVLNLSLCHFLSVLNSRILTPDEFRLNTVNSCTSVISVLFPQPTL